MENFGLDMRAGRGLRVDKEGDGTCKGDTDRAE
jgi:hypothetical protein